MGKKKNTKSGKLSYKNLTEEQKQDIADIYLNKELSWDVKEEMLAEYTGRSTRTGRYWVEKLGLTKKSDAESPQYEDAKKKKINKRKKRFLVTWAQNDTPVHEGLLSNMEVYANHIGAEIHVIAGRYHNPTSIFSKKDETWHSRVIPYLDANRHKPHKYLEVLSDIKIQPTAVNPLNSMEGITGDASCIIGHPRHHMRPVPVLDVTRPKIMITTGACTVENYTDSKAGKKAEFHHILGFVIMEIEDKDIFHLRQVSADDDGNFIDLVYSVEGGKVKNNKECDALVMGDIHVGHHDDRVIDKTFELFDLIKPKNVFLHDTLDFRSQSHHTKQNIFDQYQNHIDDKDDVAKEIDDVMLFLERFKNFNTYLVRGNHDEHLDRWLVDDANLKGHKTPKNLLTYVKYAQLIFEGKAKDGILPYLVNQKFKNIKALAVDELLEINGVIYSEHGHSGPNGSRGSILGFRKLNKKIVTGHSHTPMALDGAFSAGTSTHLRLPYSKKGASSWVNSHVITYGNGKRQHINFMHRKDGTISYTTLV